MKQKGQMALRKFQMIKLLPVNTILFCPGSNDLPRYHSFGEFYAKFPQSNVAFRLLKLMIDRSLLDMSRE